jgi:hypothetical protein
MAVLSCRQNQAGIRHLCFTIKIGLLITGASQAAWFITAGCDVSWIPVLTRLNSGIMPELCLNTSRRSDTLLPAAENTDPLPKLTAFDSPEILR